MNLLIWLSWKISHYLKIVVVYHSDFSLPKPLQINFKLISHYTKIQEIHLIARIYGLSAERIKERMVIYSNFSYVWIWSKDV